MKEIGRLLASSLPVGSMTKLKLPPYDVLVANVDGTFYAIEDGCPHSGRSLSLGSIEGHHVTCPAHRWIIDVRDGKVLTAVGVGEFNKTYRIELVGEWVVVYAT